MSVHFNIHCIAIFMFVCAEISSEVGYIQARAYRTAVGGERACNSRRHLNPKCYQEYIIKREGECPTTL